MAHIHSVYDTDKHFTIEIPSRLLQNQTPSKTSIMQYDHNSERITFDMPAVIEGHKTLDCNVVQVHYLNIDAQTKKQNRGFYEVDDLQVSPESSDIAICSWLISRNATQLAGPLYFRVSFKCVTDKVDYSWSTAIYKGLTVADGIDNSDWAAEEYADILAQWDARITALEAGGATPEQIEAAVTKYLSENPVQAGPQASIGTVSLPSADWVAVSANLHSQVVRIDGVTENSQVDLTPSVEQLVIFYEKDLTFVTENEGGVVTVYAIGQKPENDYTIQVTITEVSV